MAGEGVGVGVGAVDVGGVDGALGVERRGFSSFLSVRSFGAALTAVCRGAGGWMGGVSVSSGGGW